MSKKMRVQVRETELRLKASFMSKVQATLAYGTEVTVQEEAKGWAKCSALGFEGWVHLSALTKDEIDFKAGSSPVDTFATSDEVALAGKGFNPQVEESYREGKALDYATIDRMESLKSSPEEICAFLEAGGLDAAKECKP